LLRPLKNQDENIADDEEIVGNTNNKKCQLQNLSG
jgi:hypothetical protein